MGKLALPGFPATSLVLPFSSDDFRISRRVSGSRSRATSLPISCWLRSTRPGEISSLILARDMILAWNRYEQQAWLPNGYLWNDLNAVAVRVRVLGEFLVGACIASGLTTILRWVGRSFHRLPATGIPSRTLPTSPFSTNHGEMGNLALLHLELAFPTLPDAARYRSIALERLDQQLPFLVGDDGVIRENSAGYQSFGLNVLGMIFRTMTLLGTPVPEVWQSKYELGIHVFEQLERPDGTLPTTGDTDGSTRAWLPQVVSLDRKGGRRAPRTGPGRADRGAERIPGRRLFDRMGSAGGLARSIRPEPDNR